MLKAASWGRVPMSLDRLGTCGTSSSTLLRGMELADQPLGVILNLKEEPLDEEEQQMRQELQAGFAKCGNTLEKRISVSYIYSYIYIYMYGVSSPHMSTVSIPV